VLLLHGLGGDRRQALGLLPESFAATRIALDLPGHGERGLTPDEPLTFAAFAQEAAALLTEPVPVVGVSMGAGVALALAAARPGLVRQLVLIRPSWLDQAPPPHLAPFRAIARILTAGGNADDFRATGDYRQVAAAAPAMAQSLLAQFDRPCAAERARVLDELPLSLPLPDRAAYAALDVEVTIVAAPQDPVHPEAVARTLREWIPGSRLVTVPRKMPDATDHQIAVQHAVAVALGGGREH
jgi:pimeloyl-ACP methyl ester carboxylesterase